MNGGFLMNKKRWFALLGAAVLFVVSIISQFGANVAATDWDELLNLNEFKEKEIEAGFGGEKIVVASLEGVIQDVEANQFINAGMNNYKRFLRVLDIAAEGDRVDGIMINVNAHGDEVVESEETQDKVIEMQEEYDQPVCVRMGNMAASGGYYASAPAKKIVAQLSTLSGSIGAIMESIN